MSTITPTIWHHPSVSEPKSFKTHSEVKFGSLLPHTSPVKARQILEHLDFTAVGASPVKQIAVIFSSLITWRLLAANERRRASISKRWNELRENLMRDLLGFAFWFLGVPVLQRLYLSAVTRHNPELKDILIQRVKAEADQSKGLFNWLKSNNPLNNRYIPSSQQVKDQMHQALQTLEKAGLGPNHTAYHETQSAYRNLIKHRNFATALGLGSTILLLGVGINLLNFYLTQKNITKNLKPIYPSAPALPPMPGAVGQQSVGGQPPFPNQNNLSPYSAQPRMTPATTQLNPFQLPQAPFGA